MLGCSYDVFWDFRFSNSYNAVWHRCFPVNFAKFLRKYYFYRAPLLAASKIFSETHSLDGFNINFMLHKKVTQLILDKFHSLKFQVSKYGVFSGQYFPVFGPEKLRNWTILTQCVCVITISYKGNAFAFSQTQNFPTAHTSQTISIF